MSIRRKRKRNLSANIERALRVACMPIECDPWSATNSTMNDIALFMKEALDDANLIGQRQYRAVEPELNDWAIRNNVVRGGDSPPPVDRKQNGATLWVGKIVK